MVRDRFSTREQGVEFGDLGAELEDRDYPATTGELIEDHGDHTLRHGNGSERFEEVIDPLGEETYGSAAEVRQAVLNAIGARAVGREGYTDRDPPVHGDGDDRGRQHSF